MNSSGTTDEHRALRESLGAYALGGLDDAESAIVRAHLDGCADCRRELAEILPAARALADVDPARVAAPPQPPADLGDLIVGRMRTEGPLAGPSTSTEGPLAGPGGRQDAPTPPLGENVVPLQRAGRRGALVAAAAIVVTAIAAGSLGYIAGRPTPLPSTPVAVQAAVPGIDASASLIAHTWGSEFVLVADGFRPGGAYRMVVRDASGAEVDAGTFIGTGAQEMKCNLNSSVRPDAARGFEVLDESGAVVLTGSV